MSKVGRLVSLRIASRIGLVVAIFFGIILLVEFLDVGRFEQTAEIAGGWTATAVAFLSALRWSLLGLPVTVLLGALIGLIDLQRHRELVIVAASGHSIWSIIRWPLILVVLFGAMMATVVDSVAIRAYQQLDVAQIGWGRAYGLQNQEQWFSQSGPDGRYALHARSVRDGGAELRRVSIFRLTAPGETGTRIYAERATLDDGFWRLEDGTVLDVDSSPRPFETLELATGSTLAELSLQLGTAEDMSWFGLFQALDEGIEDPFARSAAQTRFHKLNAMPIVLAGALLIAFAFTAGYRRAGHYGWIVLNGIVLGLVVFMVIEMADRAGSAGVVDPVVASWGPAIAAVVIGLTVILRREDGRI
ncbi:LptF/LptG family permease [Pelagibacterium montanilacus]|uniref:LptF/LptG family permease n=1 Tax=Pelagibacterium montanilacus TaxID=2185280 RepID=UPI0013E0BECF|nr:LptF/LptG family permease [Pelagibacterium montanilacus]